MRWQVLFQQEVPVGKCGNLPRQQQCAFHRRYLVNNIRLIAIVLIVAGVLGLVYGGFSYTKDTTALKLGPIELSVKEKQTVNVPMWAGIGAIVAGGLLLVLGSKKG